MTATRKTLPGFVFARRRTAAITLRKELFGSAWFDVDTKRLSWWTDSTFGFFCGRGFMRYSHLFQEGRLWRDTYGLPERGSLSDLEWDDAVRGAFIAYLKVRGKDPFYVANRKAFEKQLPEGRRKMHARQALTMGLCPYCLEPLPCALHQVGRVKSAGRGKFVEIEPPPPPPTLTSDETDRG